MISPTGGHYGQAYNSSDLPRIKKEKVDVDASYTPAEIEIKTRNPEMNADWDSIREELGYLRPYAQMKEIRGMSESKVEQAIVERVQAGLRARDIHKEEGNVFGKIAFQQFLADRQKAIQLDAAPKFGIKIDVRIYPPEITVDTNVKGGAITL